MNRFIEHIINDLVRDTKIDYDREEIHFPFYSRPLSNFSPFDPTPFPPHITHLFSTPFSKYCKDTYGLIDQEVEYVWDQYKSTIKDKITNR